MTKWLRFEHARQTGFGILEDDIIQVHSGDMFDSPAPTGQRLPLAAVALLTPAVPSKFIGLWNNYRALANKLGNAIPAEPLYFLKAPSSCLANGKTIRAPQHYDGKVVFEGELGVVIGREASNVDAAEAERCIFGYTCVNDVTALDLITRDPTFAQWTRAKSFDTFGVFGPVIVTGLDPARLTIRTLLNGVERQNYPANDMIFPPHSLVSLISREITLQPGDLIACGTSIGVGTLKPGSVVEITIDGIGTLKNSFEREGL